MKFKRLSALLLSTVLLVSGCSKAEPDSIPSGTTSNISSEISDPMKQPTYSSSEIPPATSYGFNFGTKDIDYGSEELILSPMLMGGDTPTRVGFMVFIDGIPQKYCSENSSEYSYISGFDIEENSEKTHELTVDAMVDNDMSEHIISVSTILAPDFVPPLETPTFGNYHRILRNKSKKLSDEITGIAAADEYKALKAENRVLTNEEKGEYGLGEEYGTGYAIECDLQQFKRLESTFALKSGENCLTATLCAYSTMPDVQDYRVTVFVNHKPVKINGDCDCVDVKMEGGKISKTEITLENIKVGDIVYCIAAPLTEGEVAMKSSSKMVIGDKSSGSDSTSTPPSESAENISDDDTVVSSTSTPPAESAKNIDDIGAAVSTSLAPMFAIGDNLYAETKRGSAVFPALCKVNSSGDVVKTLTDFSNARAHGDKISVVKYSGDTFSIGTNTMKIMLLDKDLNVIKSLNITGSYGKIDFNEDRIVYVSNDNEICSCDWNWENHKTLFSLSSASKGAEYIVDIKLGDGFAAFNAQAEINNKDADFYGVCDFSGNYEIYRKDGINYSQVCGKTAVWGDRHTDVVNGVMPSGIFVMYTNGSFQNFRTENILESQDVFLTGENEFFTVIGDNYGVIKQYKNGVKIREISVGKGNSADNLVHTDSMLYADVIESSGRTMKCWELD